MFQKARSQRNSPFIGDKYKNENKANRAEHLAAVRKKNPRRQPIIGMNKTYALHGILLRKLGLIDAKTAGTFAPLKPKKKKKGLLAMI